MKTPAAASPEDPDEDDFYQQVYDELRELAHAKMSKEYVCVRVTDMKGVGCG